VHATFRDEEEVPGMRNCPRPSVVQLHLAVKDEERFGDTAVEVRIGPARCWAERPAVEPELAVAGGTGGQIQDFNLVAIGEVWRGAIPAELSARLTRSVIGGRRVRRAIS
jgi:hypothetical protein